MAFKKVNRNDPDNVFFAPGADAITSEAIHATIVTKCFWDESLRTFTYMESRTLEQLLHIINEWGESDAALDEQRVVEEAADVCIVIFDLLGAHGIHVAFTDCWPWEMLHELTIPRLLAHVAGVYRKQRVLEAATLAKMISYLRYKHGSVTLCNAIIAKMAKNAQRESLYGMHKGE